MGTRRGGHGNGNGLGGALALALVLLGAIGLVACGGEEEVFSGPFAHTPDWWLTQAKTVARAQGATEDAADLWLDIARVEADAGLLAGARGSCAAALPVFEGLGIGWSKVWKLTGVAAVLHEVGAATEARSVLDTAAGVAAGISDSRTKGIAWREVAIGRAKADDPGGARDALRALEALSGTGLDPDPEVLEQLGIAGREFVACGRTELALEILEATEERVEAIGSDSSFGLSRARAATSEIRAALVEAAHAAHDLEACRRHTEAGLWAPFDQVEAFRLLALEEARAGDSLKMRAALKQAHGAARQLTDASVRVGQLTSILRTAAQYRDGSVSQDVVADVMESLEEVTDPREKAASLVGFYGADLYMADLSLSEQTRERALAAIGGLRGTPAHDQVMRDLAIADLQMMMLDEGRALAGGIEDAYQSVIALTGGARELLERDQKEAAGELAGAALEAANVREGALGRDRDRTFRRVASLLAITGDPEAARALAARIGDGYHRAMACLRIAKECAAGAD